MPALINRLEPYPLERLSSLLERLRRANYYEEPRWYASLLPSPLGEPVDVLTSPEHYQAFAEITGLSSATLYELTLHRLIPAYTPAAQQGGKHQFWGQSGYNKHFHGQHVGRLCPLCWRDFGASFLPWMARHVTTCATHQVLLVDACPTCQKPLDPSYRRGVCRGCSTPLADLPAISIRGHGDNSMLSLLIWNALSSVPDWPPPIPGVGENHPLRTMRPATLLSFLWDGYALLKAYDKTNPVFQDVLPPGATIKELPRDLRLATTHEVHAALTGMWRLLRGWPQTWGTMLDRLLNGERYSIDSRPFPSALFERFNGPEYRWLHQGWVDYVGQVMHQNPAVVPWLRYYRGVQQGRLPALAPPLLSQREAARTLGVSEEQLRTFVEQGQIRVTALPDEPTPRQWQLIEAASVEELRDTRAQHLTLRETARVIGTSTDLVIALVGAGLLDAASGPLVNERAVWRFDPLVVRANMERLVGHLPLRVQPATRAEVLTFANVQRVMTRYQLRLPRILLDIQRGVLPMFRSVDDVRLDALWCENRSLHQYQQTIRPSAFPLLSVNMVCDRLGCKPTTLRRLYGVGLLIPVNDDTDLKDVRHQYNEEDVVAFLERYVASHEAAKLLGVAQLTVQSWARLGRLQPLTGPTIDGSHTYRFDKAALLQWRYERLTFGEAMALLSVSKATLDRWAKQDKLTPLADMDSKQRWFARADVERLLQNQASPSL